MSTCHLEINQRKTVKNEEKKNEKIFYWNWCSYRCVTNIPLNLYARFVARCVTTNNWLISALSPPLTLTSPFSLAITDYESKSITFHFTFATHHFTLKLFSILHFVREAYFWFSVSNATKSESHIQIFIITWNIFFFRNVYLVFLFISRFYFWFCFRGKMKKKRESTTIIKAYSHMKP